LNKAWDELARLKADGRIPVKFLADEYTLDPRARKVTSLSCNTAAKDFTAILILHYLIARYKGLPQLTGEWATFKELSGIEGYSPAFRQRAIEPVIRKYGRNPPALFTVLERLPGKKTDQSDAGIVLEVFERVPVEVLLWRGDDEFGPEANLLFDRSITEIFCTEDIVVLAGMIAAEV